MIARKKNHFWTFYIIFTSVLIVLGVICVMYVRSLLEEYERSQPEALVESIISAMKSDAESGALWKKPEYSLPEPGKFDSARDMKTELTDLLNSPDLKAIQKLGLSESDEMVYSVTDGQNAFAEITLEAVGDPVTKLIIFSWREWKQKGAADIFPSRDYTVRIPAEFTATLNGIEITDEEKISSEDGENEYLLKGICLPPKFEVTDGFGNKADSSIKNGTLVSSVYSYSLVLPKSISVRVDGEEAEGTGDPDSGQISYNIIRAIKPEIIISDVLGNSLEYGGESSIPVTNVSVKATDRFRIRIDGKEVPLSAAVMYDDPEFEQFSEYAEGLPKIAEYDISVLIEDPEISAEYPDGHAETLPAGDRRADLCSWSGSDEVPAELALQVNVLEIAEKWSLFVSKDLPGDLYGLGEISRHLIRGSYQYLVAYRYVYSIDITFISVHTLTNPPFTGEKVCNFRKITDDCFSVDISFDKHMIMNSGGEIIDSMNDRFYFLRYKDTWDAVPGWKLVAMKELVDNG